METKGGPPSNGDSSNLGPMLTRRPRRSERLSLDELASYTQDTNRTTRFGGNPRTTRQRSRGAVSPSSSRFGVRSRNPRRAMPDRRRHRGAGPSDRELFGPAFVPILREAVHDASWLLDRGYTDAAILELVGNRYQLRNRQRQAVYRSACSLESQRHRSHRQCPLDAIRGRTFEIDGYNVLITVESAMGGGVILRGRDEQYRDLASLHGTYRTVEETRPAVVAIGEVLDAAEVRRVIWYFDAPVSNSGRLASMVLKIAADRNWPWEAKTVPDPDAVLSRSAELVASSDRLVLDRCSRFVALAREVIERRAPDAWIVDLSARPSADRGGDRPVTDAPP